MTEQKSLKNLNTFGLDVYAAEYIELTTFDEAQQFFQYKQVQKGKFFILGGGSNILLTGNYDGLVIKNNLKGIELLKEDVDHVWLKVGAGENWHEFVLHCIANNYAGIENLSLIPGNVGASPMQNIGAYGVEVKDLITEVEAIHIDNGEKKVFTNAECKFDYRSSVFKTSLKNQYFISSVTFKLDKTPTFKTAYGAIKDQLATNGISDEQLSIKAISDAVIAIRQSKLPDPNEIGNSGSFFKNPIVSQEKFETIKESYAEIPAYPTPDGKVKLAAGWLIEKAGWKGFKEGDYGVHTKQALVLVNYGGASGLEIYDLSERIISSIDQTFGILLEREVNII